ncbi:MAG: histidine--tRNA ligase, partial [bacterium]|nr:histidine--tRNA ligase [bacterium]
ATVGCMSDLPKVKSALAGGFRDYLPSEMIPRQRMIATIREVFETFGFDPLDTPGMERRATLTGGDPEFRMRIFDAKVSGDRIVVDPADPDGDRTALRFDLTVPLARVVAKYMGAENGPSIRKPFKRYQVGMVWRGEKPQAGRLREFMQFDADVVGTATPVADAEIIALMVATMRALGVERYQVRFNNRKLLNGLPAYAGFDAAMAADVLRVIDKLPKIGREAVLRELTKPVKPDEPERAKAVVAEEGAENEEAAFGLGLPTAVADRVGAFLDLTGTTDELLDRASSLFAGVAIAEEGIGELQQIVAALRAMRVDEQCWQFDLSIARGLAYYTGPVFETFLTDADGKILTLPHTDEGTGEQIVEQFGSVFSGGRYDDLVTRFLEAPIPATGASVGVDRLFDYLTRLGKITLEPTRTQVFVTVMDQSAMSDYLAMAGELRSAGLRTILWVGEETAFKAQLAYATAQEIPVVIIAGDRERAAGTVTVKDMRKRTQAVVPRAELVGAVQAALGIALV